jgi:hypothetical protein
VLDLITPLFRGGVAGYVQPDYVQPDYDQPDCVQPDYIQVSDRGRCCVLDLITPLFSGVAAGYLQPDYVQLDYVHQLVPAVLQASTGSIYSVHRLVLLTTPNIRGRWNDLYKALHNII